MFVPISKVSANMGISSRTLRYWEAAGLFKSFRDAQSGWRMYDDYALQCIRVTNLLRRLDLSISDIKQVIENENIEFLCSVLKKRLSTLNKAHLDLDMLRAAISEIIDMVENKSALTLPILENMLLPVALERKKHIITKMQGAFLMENLKGKHDEVKLIKLPAARAAAFSWVGIEPEDKAYGTVKDWLDENKLHGTARIFGFNVEPYPSDESSAYGFGYCATIPEGVEIAAPLYEMKLPGGIYAVVSDYEGDPSYGWKKVFELCKDDEWEWEYDDDRNPGLEEHIEGAEGGVIIPILFPVKRKVEK